jgi:hypothetical protein
MMRYRRRYGNGRPHEIGLAARGDHTGAAGAVADASEVCLSGAGACATGVAKRVALWLATS